MQEHNTSSSAQAFAGGGECIKQAFQRKGIEGQAAEVMVNSITSTTLKQYQSSLKRWWKFRTNQQKDTYTAEAMDIIAFLSKRLEEGANYSSLCADRSAIALILGNDVRKDTMVSRFSKGVYKQKPPRPKYDSTWDTEQVLQFIKNIPMDTASLKEMEEKVATLLIIATAQRFQTLALIRIKNIEVESKEIKIKISDLTKTSKPRRVQPELVLPFFAEAGELCVASAILKYMKRTEKLRPNDNEMLFISTIKPHRDVSA